MAKGVRVTTELKNPTEVGTHHRLLCMTGPNKGSVYYLLGKRIIIGRGDHVDIQILDTKISREHAELSLAENVFTITDLGTQNGIIVNDSKVKQRKLKDNEKIVIGQTVFKYNVFIISESVEMMIAEANPDSPLAKEIKKGIKVKIPKAEIKNDLEKGNDKSDKKGKNQKKTGKSGLIIVLVIFLGVFFILMDNDSKTVSKTSSEAKNIKKGDLDIFNESLSPQKNKEDGEVLKKLEKLVHSGRREFGEGNYFRAMEEFRLALLLSPNNGQASFYLSKAKQRLDDEIVENFEKGAQEQDAKKFRAAIVSYCSVVQLIKEYPNDERYKNAMLKISAIESSLGMEKGEIKCFEEKSTNSGN